MRGNNRNHLVKKRLPTLVRKDSKQLELNGLNKLLEEFDNPRGPHEENALHIHPCKPIFEDRLSLPLHKKWGVDAQIPHWLQDHVIRPKETHFTKPPTFAMHSNPSFANLLFGFPSSAPPFLNSATFHSTISPLQTHVRLVFGVRTNTPQSLLH